MIENYEFLLMRDLANAKDKGKVSGICKEKSLEKCG